MKRQAIVCFTLSLLLAPLTAFGADWDPSLTPVGAEKSGNKDGSIPAWDGGIQTLPAGYKVGSTYVDPFVSDKPLFVMDSTNWKQYGEHLSAGQQAMFQKYPDYKMPVYPSRRSASFPDYVYSAVKANAETARLTDDGCGVHNGSVAIPFPIPKNGLQVIWNHLMHFRSHSFRRTVDEIAVTSPGNSVVARIQEGFLFPETFSGANFDSTSNILLYLKQDLLSPPRIAGTMLLVHETLDKSRQLRGTWLYNPGLRRVVRAPFVSYDTPSSSSEGLRLFDEYDMYNGATDRYDWELKGKKEIYVPYNAYAFADPKYKNSDIIGPHFINRDLTRYELHRVWVVDAVLKKGQGHIYGRRVFYIDEDSWEILLVDSYDSRGGLWRFAEAHAMNYYEVPTMLTSIEVHYDLTSGQYVTMNMHNETGPYNFDAPLTQEDFAPESLRREGQR